MTVHNLYVYHCSYETLKIMKYRTPISMFNVFKTSNRKTTQMVTQIPDIQYVYNASITWNWARQVIKSNTDISDFSFSSTDAKAILKNHILLSQKMGNSCEWNKYRDKLVLFCFLWNLSKSLNKTNMIEKNLICCYHSTEVELCDHPSIHIQSY